MKTRAGYHIHCCQMMDLFIEDIRVPLVYDPIFREYNIVLNNDSSTYQGIFYCPWCAMRLPENLREEYLEILEQDFGITDFFGEEARSKFPKDFQSDVWWKKRGL